MTEEEQFEFSDWLHKLKDAGYKGTGNKRGDFTFGELDKLAKEFREG